jgi:hypothetical protein
MHQKLYYAAEPSATTRGFIGQVKDAVTDQVLLRTSLAFPTIHEAITAARNLWATRAMRIRQAQEVA